LCAVAAHVLNLNSTPMHSFALSMPEVSPNAVSITIWGFLHLLRGPRSACTTVSAMLFLRPRASASDLVQLSFRAPDRTVMHESHPGTREHEYSIVPIRGDQGAGIRRPGHPNNHTQYWWRCVNGTHNRAAGSVM
jgi:hypothetical protein